MAFIGSIVGGFAAQQIGKYNAALYNQQAAYAKQQAVMREKVYEKEREIQEAENQRNLERQNLENVNEQQQRQAEELAELQDKLKFLEGDRNHGSSLADQLKTRVETAQESLSEFEQGKTGTGNGTSGSDGSPAAIAEEVAEDSHRIDQSNQPGQFSQRKNWNPCSNGSKN